METKQQVNAFIAATTASLSSQGFARISSRELEALGFYRFARPSDLDAKTDLVLQLEIERWGSEEDDDIHYTCELAAKLAGFVESEMLGYAEIRSVDWLNETIKEWKKL